MNLIRCGRKGHITWSMFDLLDALKQELEIMESDVPLLQTLAITEPKTVGVAQQKKNNRPKLEHTTASALHANRQESGCTFCTEKHKEKDCGKLTKLEERRTVVKKSGRCFLCFKHGHCSFKCRSRNFCATCKGRHHTSLCDKVGEGSKAPLNPSAPPYVVTTNTSNVSNVGSGGGPFCRLRKQPSMDMGTLGCVFCLTLES